MSAIVLMLAIFWTVVVLILYHKLFDVVYFNLINGIVKELVVSFIIAMVITSITIKLWWVTAIILVIAGILLSKKTLSKVPLVITIILAIVFSSLSGKLNEAIQNNSSNNTTYVYTVSQNDTNNI